MVASVMMIPSLRVCPLNVINTKPVPAHTHTFCTRKFIPNSFVLVGLAVSR